MSTELAKVSPASLPAFLRGAKTEKNKDFATDEGSGGTRVPRLTISGRVFRVAEGKNVVPITKVDEETGEKIPRSTLEVVIVLSNKGKHKQYYAGKYDPETASAPLCYSYDGVTPSVNVRDRQSPSCTTCPKNEWGSAITANGKESRACTDGKLLAVIPVGDMNNMYQLKLSPSALNRSKDAKKEDPVNTTSWGEYLELLNMRNIPIYAVVTRLYFDLAVDYPLLRFKFQRFLTEQEFAQVQEIRGANKATAFVSEDTSGFVAPEQLVAPAEAPALEAPASNTVTDEDIVALHAARSKKLNEALGKK